MIRAEKHHIKIFLSGRFHQSRLGLISASCQNSKANIDNFLRLQTQEKLREGVKMLQNIFNCQYFITGIDLFTNVTETI